MFKITKKLDDDSFSFTFFNRIKKKYSCFSFENDSFTFFFYDPKSISGKELYCRFNINNSGYGVGFYDSLKSNRGSYLSIGDEVIFNHFNKQVKVYNDTITYYEDGRETDSDKNEDYSNIKKGLAFKIPENLIRDMDFKVSVVDGIKYYYRYKNESNETVLLSIKNNDATSDELSVLINSNKKKTLFSIKCCKWMTFVEGKEYFIYEMGNFRSFQEKNVFKGYPDYVCARLNKIIIYNAYGTVDEINHITYKSVDNCDKMTKIGDVTSMVIKNDQEIIDSEKKLNELIGLNEAKKQIYRFKKTCIKALENNNPINLHMMFLGNPGTGKTTFARLVADIFYRNKILPTNNYIEGSRETLVGKYTGETEEKTNAIFQQAMGGVLFIDEAYSLYRPGAPNDFGNIAMAELIKLMEDYRGKICVIFAGYPNEMHNLLNINPGLKSRIQYEVLFDDYDKDELSQIFDIYLKNDNYSIENDAKEKIIDFVDKKRNKPNFANAREVRIAFEQLTMIQAERTFETDVDNREIKLEDVDKYIDENSIKSINKDYLYTKMINYDDLEKYSNINISFRNDYIRILESCIEIYTISGSKGFSSAFLISPDGYAVTAAHSIVDANLIRCRRRIKDRLNNTVETYHDCKICGYNIETDVAVIKIEDEFNSKFPYLPLDMSGNMKTLFTELVVFAYPLGTSMYDNLSAFRGYISSIQKIKNYDAYNVDIIAMPGSSGACLIDLDTMKVIGIVNGLTCINNDGIPFARPIKYVLDLIKEGIKNE